jgi:aryl-alcohol dehydrogenase-like predicted oxidoreductase
MGATRKIGSLDVPVTGLGCNNFGMTIDEDQTRAVVDAAVEAGVTHFDTAEVYGNAQSEVFLGRALGDRRADVVITTKVGGLASANGFTPGDPTWVARAIDESLTRLGTDYVDLYLLHMPDAETPIGDTLEALAALVAAGKVREIGCSNFSPEQLDEAARVAGERGVGPFVNVQSNYSLLDRGVEDGVVPACERLGMSLVPYFPLASGMLTGKYQRAAEPPKGTRLAGLPEERREQALSDRNFDKVEALDGWARDHGHSLLELAFSWLLARPAVASVIAGATKPEQVAANAAAANWSLTDADLAEIDAVLESVRGDAG